MNVLLGLEPADSTPRKQKLAYICSSGLSVTVSLMAVAEPIQFSFYSSPQFMTLTGVPGDFGEKMR